MFIKFCLCLILIVLTYNCIEGAKIKNPSNEKNKEKDVESENRPQYIKQFSQSLKYLNSFFQTIERQLNNTITSFTPNRPNPLFTAILSNPNLLTFALKRLREPIAEMVTITEKLQTIVSSSGSGTQLEQNNELSRLLQQLQRRLQTMFGPLMPNNGLTYRPANFPAAIESFSKFVSQLALVLSVFSQSVRDVTNVQNPNTMSNRSQFVEMDNICSKIHLYASSDLIKTEVRQGQQALLPAVLGGLTGIIAGLLGIVGNLLTTVDTSVVGGGGAQGQFIPSDESSSGILLPLEAKQIQDFQQISFGFVNEKNKLIITNILTKDLGNNSSGHTVGDKQQLLSRMSLNSLHSLMSSLVNDFKDIKEPKTLSAFKCQLEGFDCSIRNRDNYSEVQTCLKTLSSCISTDL